MRGSLFLDCFHYMNPLRDNKSDSFLAEYVKTSLFHLTLFIRSVWLVMHAVQIKLGII